MESKLTAVAVSLGHFVNGSVDEILDQSNLELTKGRL